MLLSAKTTVYITSRDGTTTMSFIELTQALKGGLQLDEVEITTDPEHSKKLERKRIACQEVQHLMANMTPEQAEKVVDMLRSDEDLMELHDDYA